MDSGCGTLISDNDYDQVRRADLADIAGILSLIRPLEEKGILVSRSREMLESEIDHYIVEDRDGMIVGCAALHFFESEKCIELSCVAVEPRYRGTGRGDKILAYALMLAKEAGMKHVFVLTTQTAHWFVERGFRAAAVGDLPVTRRQMYNLQRNSKVFIRDLP
jgi:amino-acid N-acetyltransferase